MVVGVAGSSAASSSAACSQAQPFIAGTPSQSLLSILGVLRRPATSSDALPESIKTILTASFKSFGVEVFADYIRRAGVVAGTPYYVMPVLASGCGALRGGGSQTMMLWGGGGGSGAGDAAEIEQGTALDGGSSSFGQSTANGLVPDGVTTVTLSYPAGKIGAFDHKQAPVFTTTKTIVSNLLVATIPRGGSRLLAPMTMTWRAANGKIIKTFNKL